MRKTIPGSTIASLTGIAAERIIIHLFRLWEKPHPRYKISRVYRTREILLRALGVKIFPDFEQVPVNKIPFIEICVFFSANVVRNDQNININKSVLYINRKTALIISVLTCKM